MADKSELLHLPQPDSSLLIRSEAHSGLITRGRKDAASLAAHQSKQLYRAIVRVRTGSRFDGAGKLVLPSPPQRCGLIDNAGKFIVDPFYYGIEPFSSGLAAFSISPVLRQSYSDIREELFNADRGLWGYLDQAGKVVIAPRFERTRGFSEQVAAVEINGKWGFIHKDGSFSVEPRFDGVRDFNDGLAVARMGSKCGFIDSSGEFVIEPQFNYLSEFSEDLAQVDVNGQCGYIDRSGGFAIAPQFKPSYFQSGDFRQGVAIVGDADGFECVINRVGEVIFQCREDGESISDFVNGIARVSESGGYGDHAYFIDSAGQPLLKNIEGDEDASLADELDAADDFSEGLGLVAGSYLPGNCDMVNGASLWPLFRYANRGNSTRLYGFIDTHGEMKIPPRFHSAQPFSNGLAAVEPNGDKKYGFIDATGNMVIEPRFTQVRDFKNGMARVKEDTVEGKWGFIDKIGRVVIPYQFDQGFFAEDFQQVAHQ